MGLMVLLLPGLPGGIHVRLIDRTAYVASHRRAWRTGWFSWQLTALSNLLLGIALLRTNWIRKLPAILSVVTTVVAIIPDQTGQVLWMWWGPSMAAHAVATGNVSGYAEFETHTFLMIAGWAPLFYIAGALGWSWCFAAARIWSRGLTIISLTAWIIFAISALVLITPKTFERAPCISGSVGVGNAIALLLLVCWLAILAERVLRRSRPVTQSGRYAIFRHPRGGLVGRCCNLLANSRLARAVAGLIGPLAMDSDITDVIYVNYLVDADRIEHLVEAPLKLQRLGPDERYALFTFLTFQHGHFGPRCFGFLRRLWPSPIQSNWRIYVFDSITGKRGIQFLTIATTGTPYALAARLLAENIPMHVPAQAKFVRHADGTFRLQIDPGTGTAPDVDAQFQLTSNLDWPETWRQCFDDWQTFLAYCVPQDRAMSSQPWLNLVTRQEINLNIPVESCRPMIGQIQSAAAQAVAGDSLPVCFHVERVFFRLLKECCDPRI